MQLAAEGVYPLILPELTSHAWPSAATYAVVIDRRVHALWYRRLRSLLPPHVLMIRTGTEATKRFRSLEAILSFFMEQQLPRDSVVIGIGGGAHTDAVGLAAALYKRGLRTVWLPTTILAMVDAAVGGKTAVNFRHIKNIVGTYHFPEQVVIVPDFIETLPSRQRLSGLGEMLKHALIEGETLWADFLEGRIHPAMPPEEWRPVLGRAAAVKVEVVQQDPYEKSLRKVLNAGHTIGHAIEGYFAAKRKHIPHGIAVAWGLLWESRLSHHIGRMSPSVLASIETVIARLFPPFPAAIALSDLLPWMRHDKKNRQAAVGFALIERPGKIDPDVLIPPEELASLLGRLGTTS